MAARIPLSSRIKEDEQQLLELEVEAIFGLDYDEGSPALRSTCDLRAVHIWSSRAAFTALHPSIATHQASSVAQEEVFSPGSIPLALSELCASLNQPLDCITGGPSYTFPSHQLQPKQPSPLPIIVSNPDGQLLAQSLHRPSSWESSKWEKLTHGKFGDWAMAVHDNRPVSICFSARRRPMCAEAGAWTHEDFRGRGLAPAVVAAWAGVERRSILFYSTGAGNLASQAVASALGLEPLGWIWKLHSTPQSSSSSL